MARGDEGSCNTHPTSRAGIRYLQFLILLGLSIVGSIFEFALEDSKAPVHPSRSHCPRFPVGKGRLRVRKGSLVLLCLHSLPGQSRV